MGKKLEWQVDVEGELHEVSLEYNMLLGKAIVGIDGDKFDISTGFMKLRGTSQVFKLGDKQAILDFPKKGKPDVIFDGESLNARKN